jgi:hypothetical protein
LNIPPEVKRHMEMWAKEKKFGNIQLNYVNGVIKSFNTAESLRVTFSGNLDGVSVSPVSNDVNLE